MSVNQITTTDSSMPELVEYGSNSEMDRSAFLKLLTVQLANQDPLDPMDSDQMAQQQVMYAELEQLMNLNDNITGFMESQEDVLLGIAGVFNTLESASFLGKNVAFFTDELYIDESGSVPELYYDLTQDALVSYTVRDENGIVVESSDSVIASSGNHIPIGWDGTDSQGTPVQAGKYTITLNVQDTLGKALSGKTYGDVTVQSIDFRNGTPELTLVDGRTVSVSEILALSEIIGE